MSNLINRVKFIGKVNPDGFKVNIRRQEILFAASEGAFEAKFTINIVDSVIDVVCDFDNVLKDHSYKLWVQAQEITQTLVNLIAFKLGAGVITMLNRWVNEFGVEDGLAFGDPRLPALCTAFSLETFNPVMNLVFAEPELFMAINDIVLANAMPRHVLLNCARCIEAIRHLIAPINTERSAFNAGSS